MATGERRKIALASASPRRRQLLQAAEYDVVVIPSGIDESVAPGVGAPEAVVDLALRKARAVKAIAAGLPVLGADTEVVLDGRVLGKPGSRAEAADMLAALSGRPHQVFTGVALCAYGREWTGLGEARVRFRVLSPAAIATYLGRAAFADKAGAYGIQEEGAELVAHYDGRLDTIVGLPMDVVDNLWRKAAKERS